MYIPTETGHWVDENFERLARVVQDYDPRFELRWIPPEHRSTDSDRAKPYVIWDTDTNTPVFHASELDTPTDILERLFAGDISKGDVLARIDKHNAAIKAMELKAQLDEAEERQEYVAWLIGSKKNYLTLPGGRRVDDQLRPLG